MDKLTRFLQELNIPVVPKQESPNGMKTNYISSTTLIPIDIEKSNRPKPTKLKKLEF